MKRLYYIEEARYLKVKLNALFWVNDDKAHFCVQTDRDFIRAEDKY